MIDSSEYDSYYGVYTLYKSLKNTNALIRGKSISDVSRIISEINLSAYNKTFIIVECTLGVGGFKICEPDNIGFPTIEKYASSIGKLLSHIKEY